MASQNCQIVIAGGGIVGASLALALARDRQLNITLIDAGGARQPIKRDAEFDPRCIALNQSSIDLLESLDVWDSIAQQRHCNYQYMHVWEFDGTGNIDFGSDTNINIGTIVENKIIGASLWQQLSQTGNVTLLTNTKVEQCRYLDAMKDHYIQLQCTNSKLSEPLIINAQLLCIAEGVNSSLHDQLQFQSLVVDCPQSAIACAVQLQQPHQNTAWQRFLPTGPLALLPLPAHPNIASSEGYLCSVVWSMDNPLLNEALALSNEQFCNQMAQSLDYRFGNIQLVSERFNFNLTQRQTTNYVKPSAVVVGDCAHSIHPLAGQGANLGLADTKILADCIHQRKGLVLNDQRLLRRYRRQRQVANWTMGAAMDVLRRLYGANHPSVRLARNSGMNLVNRSVFGKQLLEQHARYG